MQLPSSPPLVPLAGLGARALVFALVTTPAVAKGQDAATAPTPTASSAAVSLTGLFGPASASIDALGIPLIEAGSLADAVMVEGYLHARDRYAQMDLMRRFAAGEIAELLGPLATAVDRQQRVMRLRAAAQRHVAALDDRHRALLKAYVRGVNAGLASLETPPAEHRLFQLAPTSWTEEDSLLVALSMCAMLNDGARIEQSMGTISAVIPAPILAYLAFPISTSDAPVIADSAPPELPAIPGPDVVDTRGLAVARPSDRSSADPASTLPLLDAIASASEYPSLDCVPGSNGWVVSGSRSTTGAAILANDMHLAITIPSVWYRASLRYGSDVLPSPKSEQRLNESDDRVAPRNPPGMQGRDSHELDGLTLPGAPGVVSGTNGRIAWGFTNVEGDFIDFVVIELDPTDPSRYLVPKSLVPEGSEPFRIARETLRVRGLADQTIDIKETRWGPIVATDSEQRPLAMRWTALDEGGVNLDLLDLAEAANVHDALDVAARWRGAQQNVMVAGANGEIGWTISGALPRRSGFDGSVPTSWADGTRSWVGSLEGSDRPRVENPASGVIVTANQRTMPANVASQLGSLWGEPYRAVRIQALIAAVPKHDERSMAAIQLDNAVPRLIAWRDAILPALERAASDGSADGQPTELARKLAPLIEAVRAWNGRADAGEKAVAPVDQMRRRISKAIVRGIVEAAIARGDPSLSPAERTKRADKLARVPTHDEPILRIVLARPEHLLPPGEASWDAFIQRTARESLGGISGKAGLLPWGQINTSDFSHPLAKANPALASQFGIPSHEQSGHPLAVRVAAPTFGASERLVVSPGHEASALIQTPGGQSGDPKSVHYADLHPSWRDGQPLPLLPGVPVSRLEFVPAATPAHPDAVQR
ncbi:MAG: penicillin acylase family protein [Phycisphaerae bacterium]|nr:penicillin acylase family protein [Phycisphaerae bacterium]